MIAAILSALPSSYTMHQLADIGQLRGHEMVVVGYRECVGHSFGHESRTESPEDPYAKYEAFFSLLARVHGC